MLSAMTLCAAHAFAQDGYQELAKAKAGEFSGKKVTMFGTLSGEDTERFRAAMTEFEKQTGITIEYEGSKDFETLITVRAEGGNAPDIAGFSQPGLLANLVRKGYGVDLSTFMSMDQLKNDYIQSWLDLATVDGKLVGVFYRASTRARAEALGVVGYARNLPDGRVEVLACGSAAAVQALCDWLWHGPPAAAVTAVDCEPVAPASLGERPAGFVTY